MTWMKVAWISFAIMTVVSLVMTLAGFVTFLRPISGCATCLSNIFQLVVLIGLWVARGSDEGVECAANALMWAD